MSPHVLERPRRSLVPLATVTIAALVFAVLLVLVRLQWPPLESVDHGAAAGINRLIAGNAGLVAAVTAVAGGGSDAAPPAATPSSAPSAISAPSACCTRPGTSSSRRGRRSGSAIC